jgi:uncharacterized protein YbgA (DUF1722 family)/uncharacterized protein YbbK (DUF523 family)
MEDPIRLGISACLLGHEVRYNGGHSKDSFIVETLGKYVEFVSVCPEVECGFPTPREAFRLVGIPDAPRFITSNTKKDYTERMRTWAEKRTAELEQEGLCGFIFRKGSPSSGMERVKVYSEKGMPVKKGIGMFARAFMKRFPLLPVEEDGRLHDLKLRENFIESIFVLKRWRDELNRNKTRGRLVEFHTRHKLLIRSHSLQYYTAMGKLVAAAKETSLNDLYNQYQSKLMESLKLKTTVKKNVDVLLHIMGYFKKLLSSDEKHELLEIVDHYRNGHLPLIVPVTLLNHFVRKYDQEYLKKQYYLNPHPVELKLRNHV